MLLAAKNKGFFLDIGEKTTSIARTSAASAPCQIEILRECPTDDPKALLEILNELKPKKTTKGYTRINVGFSSDKVFIRRASLDVKRLKEDGYLAELVSNQYKIDPLENSIAVLNATDGRDFDSTRNNPEKEVIICGVPENEAKQYQSELLQKGIYPRTLELSSVASLGAMVDYLKFIGSTKPTLVLELGLRQTQAYIVTAKSVEACRSIASGLGDMVPVVQKELGLKDEESARKLFFSNTFDFTGMGAALCKRLLKELQSSIGFYEVQTGQSIGQIVCTVLPPKLAWIEGVLATQIGVTALEIDLPAWLKKQGIGVEDAMINNALDARKIALCGLMCRFNTERNEPAS